MRAAWQAEIDEMLDEYGHLRRRLASLRADLAGVCVSARSADGTVRATVGAQGRLMALVLEPSALRPADAAGLAARIVATVATAAERAAVRSRELVAVSVPERFGAALAGEADLTELLPTDPTDLTWLRGG